MFDTQAADDLRRLGEEIQRRILKSTKKKLSAHPKTFGKPLRGELSGYWSLRIGDYRVVYEIKEDVAYIWAVLHRPDAYEKFIDRIT